MIAEFDLGGIFVSGALVSAAIAFVLLFATGRLLRHVGVYEHVWHRHLFNVALFVILWAGAALIVSHNLPGR